MCQNCSYFGEEELLQLDWEDPRLSHADFGLVRLDRVSSRFVMAVIVPDNDYILSPYPKHRKGWNIFMLMTVCSYRCIIVEIYWSSLTGGIRQSTSPNISKSHS